MAGFLGMNADEVEKLGHKIQGEVVNDIESVISKMNAIVGQLPQVWQGPDSQRFANDWPSHRGHLTAVVNELKTFGASALKEASQQRTTSK